MESQRLPDGVSVHDQLEANVESTSFLQSDAPLIPPISGRGERNGGVVKVSPRMARHAVRITLS